MIEWLAAKVGGKLVARLIVLASVCALVASIYGAGYWHGSQANQKKTETAQLNSDLTQAQEKIDKLKGMQSENEQLTRDLAVARGKTDIVYRTIYKEAKQAANAIVATSSDGTRTMCAIPNGFVSVWDNAIQGVLRDATNGIPITVAGADYTATASEFSSADILTNHVENAERENANRQQCNALIEWHRIRDKESAAQ